MATNLELDAENYERTARMHLNSAIRWNTFEVIWAGIFFPVNLVLYVFGSHSPVSLVVATIMAGFLVWNIYSLRKNMLERVYRFGPTRRR